MIIWLLVLLAVAYLLGSIPAAQIVTRRYHRIDLREYGTGQMGAGNLWRMTSWRLGLPVGIFDFAKGLVMVLAANLLGLDIAQQILVGSAAIIGHNWSVFSRFSGGRGVATTCGIIFILPLINGITPWAWISLVFFAILAIGSVTLRSSPVPVLACTASLPLAGWGLGVGLPITLSYLAILLILIIKRLTPPLSAEAAPISLGRVLLNRLLFDRDIMDRKFWMYRNSHKNTETGNSLATNK